MPYSPDVRVPRSLIALLNARLGEEKAKALLHDFLEYHDDNVLKAEMATAIGGKIVIERDVVLGDDGYSPVTRLTYSAKIDGNVYTEKSMQMPVMPESVAHGLVNQPVKSVIDSPFHGDEKILTVCVMDDKLLIGHEELCAPIKDLKIGLKTRLMGRWRQIWRHQKINRKIDTHEGVRLINSTLSIMTSLALSIVMAMAIFSFLRYGLKYDHDHYAYHVLDVFALISFVSIAIFMTYLTSGANGNSSALREYTKKVTEKAFKDGIRSKDQK